MILWSIICYMSFLAVMIYLEYSDEQMQSYKADSLWEYNLINFHQWLDLQKKITYGQIRLGLK